MTDKIKVISQNCGTAHSEKIDYKALLEKVLQMSDEVYCGTFPAHEDAQLSVHSVEFTASELAELRRIEREISER